MNKPPVQALPAASSSVGTRTSYRSAVPTRYDVLKEIMNTEECRHPIVLALVSKGCRQRIEFENGQLIDRPYGLEQFSIAAGSGTAFGFDDSNPETTESKCLTQARVVIRYPKDLIVLETRLGLEKDYRAHRYSEALVEESVCGLQALSASDVAHVEHILLLTSDIAENDPLLHESVDGKNYIAEFKGIECGTQSPSIEHVYRVFTLARAPRDCFESQDMTDFWASNLFGDQTLRRGRLPGAKLWYNVPPSFQLVPGVAAFMRVLGFTELGVNDETSPRNMALMLTEAEASGDELAERVKAAIELRLECEEQQRLTVAYYEAQARVMAAENRQWEAKAQDFESQIAEVHRRTGEQLAAMKRKSEILEVKIEELRNEILSWAPKRSHKCSTVSDALAVCPQRSLAEAEVDAQPG